MLNRQNQPNIVIRHKSAFHCIIRI